MRRLALDLDQVDVESFPTDPSGPGAALLAVTTGTCQGLGSGCFKCLPPPETVDGCD
jgi:hypothetical protein